MTKSIITLGFLGVFALAAQANDIVIYFGRAETVPPTTAFASPHAIPGSLTTPPASPRFLENSVTVGIWATIQCDLSVPGDPLMDIWNGLSVNIIGDELTVSGLTMDNFDHRIGMGTAYRWESTSDFGGGDNGFYLVSVTRFGLGGLWAREWGLGNGSTDWWTYTSGTAGEPGAAYRYWLGNVTLTCPPGQETDVYFQIGSGGISRSGGGPTDRIFFGEDELEPLLCGQFFSSSYLPDLTLGIPEPAGLLLLSIAVVPMRRR